MVVDQLSCNSTSEWKQRLSGLKVLAVDDHEDFVFLLQTWFKKYGVDIKTVQSGEDCLNLTLSSTYDVILLDVHLPSMDGIKVCREIRGRGQPMCVVAVTASCMKQEIEHLLQSGFDDFVGKPVDWNRLLTVLDNCRKRVNP